jgi:hypothetical protein
MFSATFGIGRNPYCGGQRTGYLTFCTASRSEGLSYKLRSKNRLQYITIALVHTALPELGPLIQISNLRLVKRRCSGIVGQENESW